MYQNYSPLFRYGLPITVLGLGGLMLFLPGSDAAPRASSVSGDDPRETRRYLEAPDLVEQLDAMLAPAASAEVLVQEMRLPEPTIGNSDPLSNPALSAHQKSVSASSDTKPDEGRSTTTELRVGNQWLNLRTAPSTTADIIRTLQPGAALTRTETHRGWVSVVTESGESGWVYSTYLNGPTEPDAGERKQPKQVAEASEGRAAVSLDAQRYAELANDAHLREGPSQDAGRLFKVSAGERVEVSEVRGGWARVVLRSGAIGWVRLR